jgi:hypothetical protein
VPEKSIRRKNFSPCAPRVSRVGLSAIMVSASRLFKLDQGQRRGTASLLKGIAMGTYMRTLIRLVADSLLLAGCTTPVERAAKLHADIDSMIVTYGPACVRMGFSANTDPWRNCVLQLSAKEDIKRHGVSAHYYANYGRPYWGAGGWWGPYW